MYWSRWWIQKLFTHIMLIFHIKIFKDQHLLNSWKDLFDIWTDIRYWAKIIFSMTQPYQWLWCQVHVCRHCFSKQERHRDHFLPAALASASAMVTLVLLNPNISRLYKRCRSRSVGFFRSQLIWICTVCHEVCEFVSTNWIKLSDWLKILSRHGILIYSAGQGLSLYI